MSIKILGAVDKLISNDERVIQLSGDMDGIIASFYDKANNPSLFLDGTSARLGNVGVKTTTPNEALTVVGNISATGNLNASTLYGNGSALYIGSNLIPTTSAFYIGDVNNPVNGIFISANSLHLGSTFSGVTGLGLSNVDNSLTITGKLSTSGLISQQKNHCVASLSANQAMTNSDTKIEFHDKDDPNNWWNSANHTFQPTVAGYYNIMVMVNWVGVNHEVQVNNQLRKNGNTIALVQMPIPNSQTHSVMVQAITHMNGSSDYLDVSGFTGHNTNITGEANGVWTKFEAFKIS